MSAGKTAIDLSITDWNTAGIGPWIGALETGDPNGSCAPTRTSNGTSSDSAKIASRVLSDTSAVPASTGQPIAYWAALSTAHILITHSRSLRQIVNVPSRQEMRGSKYRRKWIPKIIPIVDETIRRLIRNRKEPRTARTTT